MIKYKRYMVFLYYEYYPAGGLCDCVRDFSNKKHAFDCVKKHPNYDYYEVFDRIEGVEIFPKSTDSQEKSEKQAEKLEIRNMWEKKNSKNL